MPRSQQNQRPSRGKRRKGRPLKNAGVARSDILRAALEVFAQRGLEGASLREIARKAKVDPALPHHYFDGKVDLFLSAVRMRLQPPSPGSVPPDETENQRAARLIRTFFERWGDGSTAQPFRALIASTAASPAVARLVQKLFVSQLFPYVAKRLGRSNADRQAGLVAAQLIGLGVIRNVLALEPLASMPLEEFSLLTAPGVAAALRTEGPP
jgi:AcrR family transcriptional regulator